MNWFVRGALSALQYIFYVIDLIIYSLIRLFSNLFNLITNIRLFDTTGDGSTSFIDTVANNIYVLIGIIAIFKVVFALINMLINPELLSDKQKGAGSLVTRFLVMLILTIAVPFIFDLAFDFQKLVIHEDLIGKIISPQIYQESTKKVTAANAVDDGEMVANTLFRSFVSQNDKFASETSNFTTNIPPKCKDAWTALNNVNKDDKDVAGISKLGPYVTAVATPKDAKDDEFCLNYMWFVSSLAGGFAAWMFIIFCLDLGIRVVKLSFLQLIAPVPIVSYINSSKDGPFQNWVKSCVSTYVDVFIRIIIINFTFVMIREITKEFAVGGNFWRNNALETTNPGLQLLAGACVILGLLAFAMQAPKLIKDVLGIKGDGSSDYGLGFNKLKQRTAAAGAVGAVAGVGVSNLAKAGVDKGKNVYKDKLAQGLAQGMTESQAKKAALSAGLKSGVLSSLTSGVGSSIAGIGSTAFRSAGMLGKKDATIDSVFNKSYATGLNNRDARDKRQAAGYTFRDNMLDRGRVLVGLDPKAKELVDNFSNAVANAQGNASNLKSQAYDWANSRGIDPNAMNAIANAVKHTDGRYYGIDTKTGGADISKPIFNIAQHTDGNYYQIDAATGGIDINQPAAQADIDNINLQLQFRSMIDASNAASVDAIKLGKVRDEMANVKDRVTSNVKDAK